MNKKTLELFEETLKEEIELNETLISLESLSKDARDSIMVTNESLKLLFNFVDLAKSGLDKSSECHYPIGEEKAKRLFDLLMVSLTVPPIDL